MDDFNAQRVNLNCNRSNGNDGNLFKMVEKHNLFIYNPDYYTHIDKYSKSNINLVLSNNSIADKVDINM